MNRKEAIAVTALLFGTFITGAFADTISTSPTRTTLQTTSVDIEVAKVPGLSSIFGGGGILIADYDASTPKINLTATFSFAPPKGFVQVNSVLVTIIYSPTANLGEGASFLVRLNGHLSTTLPIARIQQSTVIGTLPSQDLRVGSNQIDMSVAPPTSVLGVYEVRLTVEYTFSG